FDFERNQTNNLLSEFGSNYRWVISPLMVAQFELYPEDIRGIGSTFTAQDFKLWKYLGAEANSTVPRPNNDQNWILYRMADIYLMKAEALVMQGAPSYGEALDLVNRVRARAGITVPLSLSGGELEMLDMVLN